MHNAVNSDDALVNCENNAVRLKYLLTSLDPKNDHFTRQGVSIGHDLKVIKRFSNAFQPTLCIFG
jgi:hypothetical protein